MGCPKCGALADRTGRRRASSDVECRVEKITDIEQIARFGIMSTPALVVDGQVRLQGHVPTVHQLKDLLR